MTSHHARLICAIACALGLILGGVAAQGDPSVMNLDLVQGEWESVELPALPEGAGTGAMLALTVPACEGRLLPAESLELQWLSPDGWLLPAADHQRPAEDSVAWLVLRQMRAEPGLYSGQVRVTAGGQESVLCELQVRMWPIELPPTGSFLYKPWYDVTMWGSRDADPAQQERVEAFADHLASLRATVAEQGMPFNDYVTRAKLAETGEPVSALADRPEVLAKDPLPRLDFSRYDPWYRALLERGFTRVDIHQTRLTDARLAAAVKFATGQDYEFGSPEWERYYTWLLGEFKRYLLELGFDEVWVKVRDEIGITEVDDWLVEAEMFKRHGWQVWTTITDYVARRADAVSRMNPVCDGWTLSHMLFDEFDDLVKGRWVRREGEATIGGEWKQYQTGGAENTYSQQVFDLPDLPQWKMVETLRVFEGDTELRMVQGPWGNKEHGVFANRGAFIYMTPTDGSDPRQNARTCSIRYVYREPSEDGEQIAAIDPEDKVLYYSSLGRDRTYVEERRLAWLALARGLEGYGTWTYYWWKEDSRSVEWMDGRVISSPAVEGIRDGNEDAALYLLARERAPQGLASIIGAGDSILPMEDRVYEKYVAQPKWRDIKVESAEQFRAAKHALLELLVADGGQ